MEFVLKLPIPPGMRSVPVSELLKHIYFSIVFSLQVESNRRLTLTKGFSCRPPVTKRTERKHYQGLPQRTWRDWIDY